MNVPLGVEDTKLLEDLGDDGDSGVDRVGDDEDEGVGGGLGNAGSKIPDDSGVDLGCSSVRRLGIPGSDLP